MTTAQELRVRGRELLLRLETEVRAMRAAQRAHNAEGGAGRLADAMETEAHADETLRQLEETREQMRRMRG